MKKRTRPLVLSMPLVLGSFLVGCTGLEQPPLLAPDNASKISDPVRISIVVKPNIKEVVKPGSRIVITDIEGNCSVEVQDALMQRLIDNANYDVLTRRYLGQVLEESDRIWKGSFNTTTGAKIGELLGASLFIVGRVIYCGNPDEAGLGSRQPQSHGRRISVVALLQILDLESGKVVLSTAAEGSYDPKSSRSRWVSDREDQLVAETLIESRDLGRKKNNPKNIALERTKRMATEFGKQYLISKLDSKLGSIAPELGRVATEIRNVSAAQSYRRSPQVPKNRMHPGLPSDATGNSKSSEAGDSNGEKSEKDDAMEKLTFLPTLRAAQDLADNFAEKFFARPSWETVEMWDSQKWHYGDSIRYVQLGRCPQAVTLLESVAVQELHRMEDWEVAEYLHNFGVALLCANRSGLAVRKLRAAFRINKDQETRRMISLASKVSEWSLEIEVDQEPEMEILMERARKRHPASFTSGLASASTASIP